MEHLVKHKLLHQAQHGFVPRRSCLTILLKFMNSVTEEIDKGKTVYCAYLDLSKAFDVLNHEVLIQRLQRIGIGGKVLNWIQEFLSNRKYQVKVGSSRSSFRPVTSGVPQGSVFGTSILHLVHQHATFGSKMQTHIVCRRYQAMVSRRPTSPSGLNKKLREMAGT